MEDFISMFLVVMMAGMLGTSVPKPQVIGHRGFLSPENSLLAFHSAEMVGCNGVELDIRKTACGQVVVFHDPDLERLTGKKGVLADLTYKQLLEGYELKDGEKIPLLGEVLDFIHDTTLSVNIEIKVEGLEEQLVRDIHEHPVDPSKVMVSSFIHKSLSKIRDLDPDVKLCPLFSKEGAAEKIDQFIAFAKEIDGYSINVHHSAVSPSFTRRAHENGILVQVWTPDEETHLKHMVQSGVDYIITNRPDRLIAILN